MRKKPLATMVAKDHCDVINAFGMVAMGKYIHNDLPITMFACHRNELELNPIKMEKKFAYYIGGRCLSCAIKYA